MKTLIALFVILNTLSYSQITENFNDGDFTNNPTWSGDASQFIVNPLQQLQLNSSGTDISHLSCAFSQPVIDSVEWRCYVKMPFSPSSGNNGRIYMVSDQSNLEGPLNGYFLQLGESLGNDAVELFRQDGLITTSIARCTDGAIANAFALGIRVTRSASAEWKIYIDYSGGTSYTFENSGIDGTYNASSFFGVVCTYTSSNSANFFFDDFTTGPITVDSDPPAISKITLLTPTTADLKFNEQVDAATASDINNYVIDNSIGSPSSAVADAVDETLVHLTFPAISPSTIYTLTVNNVKDLNNNTISSNATVQFALADTARENDIVINEVLFNSFTGSVDFVEIYNRSAKVIDLFDMKIANTDEITGETDVVNPIIGESHLFFPGEYRVLTEDPADVRSRYNSGALNLFIDIADLPTYNDDEGGVVLLNSANAEIDRFIYNDDMHFELLDDVNGISLERISPDRPSEDKSNWHSASAASGFATPALKNSQHSASVSDGSEITIMPEIFSPDNDGHEDVLNIHYKFDKPGYTANVKIFNSNGRPVIDLVQNELLGTEEGVWSWDGINHDNLKSGIGIYVLFIEAFNASGDTKQIKKTCVLGAKL